MIVNLYTTIDGAPASSKTISQPIRRLAMDIKLLHKELVKAEAGSPYEIVEIVKDGKHMVLSRKEVEDILVQTHGPNSGINVYTKRERFGLPFESRTIETQARLNKLLQTRKQAQKNASAKFGYFTPTPIGSFLNESIVRARSKKLIK